MSILLWFLTLELVAFSAAPTCALAMPGVPDRGYGISKCIGLLVVSFLAWTLSLCGILTFTRTAFSVVALTFFLFSSWLVCQRWGGWKRFFRSKWRDIILVEALFLGGAGLFLITRAYHPEIFWGEKPMDFTFLNYFIRLEHPPAMEPWAAGKLLHYYYFGYFLFAVLHKISGVDSAIGYNLAIATIAAMLICSLYSALGWFSRRRLVAAAGALAIVSLSNLEVLRLALLENKPWNFDLFWASTRLFTSPAFAEYPLWAFLFADLHAHVIALPFVAALFALAPGILMTSSPRSSFITHRLLMGFVLASLFALNSWDLPCVGLMVGSFLLFPRWRGIWPYLRNLFLSIIVIGGIAAIVILIFLPSFRSVGNMNYGLVREGFNRPHHIFFHLGGWLIPLTIGITSAVVMKGWRSYKILQIRAALLFFLAAAILVGTAERFFIMDRMNTIFKFYNSVWLMLGISAVGLTAYLLRYRRRLRGWNIEAVTVKLTFVVLILTWGAALSGSVINVYAMMKHSFVEGPRPTLNGMAYLFKKDADEARLIDWMRSNIAGTPTVLEAHGPSYQEFTRISMNTGIPTVLGWNYHVEQRGVLRQEIMEREQDIKTIYSVGNVDTVMELLNQYGVDYIVASRVERTIYPASGLQIFEQHPDRFPLVYRAGRSVLYGVSSKRRN